MGRKRKSDESETKEKDIEMTAEEKLLIAHFYADHCDALEGKFEGASKNGKESRREKAYKQLADELTQLGVAVRTVERVKKKVRDMKDKVKRKLSEQKIAQNKTGGGSARIIMSPSTKVMAEVTQTSDSVNGIPGAIDTNSMETLDRAKKRLFADEDDFNRSVDEDDELDETPGPLQRNEPTETPSIPAKSALTKRDRHDGRKQYSLPLRNEQQKLIDAELELSKARLALVQWKIAHKKLQVFTLRKGLSPAEVNEAFSLELATEQQFLEGDF